MTGLRIIAISALVATVFAPLHADDRTMFGLKGDIATVTIENSDDDGIVWSTTVTFDADGLIEEIDGKVPSLERDSSGRLTRVTITEEDEDGQPVDVVTTLTYTLDTPPRVATATTTSDEEQWSYTYSYTPDGLTATRTYSSGGDTEKFVYSYNAARDSHDNWVERTETADGAEFPLTQRLTATYR